MKEARTPPTGEKTILWAGLAGLAMGCSAAGSGAAPVASPPAAQTAPHDRGSRAVAALAAAEPDMFAPGLISTAAYELNAALTPDGNTLYYTISPPRRSLNQYVIVVSHYRDGRWSEPEVAPFSGQFSDADPLVSPDGKRIYFISNRAHGDKPAGRDYDLWYVEQSSAGWSEAINLGPAINTDKDEFYVSVTNDGTIYYSAAYEDGLGSFDVYRARRAGTGYAAAEMLPAPVNSQSAEFDPYVAPDESYLIFSSFRPGGQGSADLYISWNQNGTWTEPVNLGDRINSAHFEFCPIMAPDGQHFFFTSERVPEPTVSGQRSRKEWLAQWRSPLNGLGNIYRVPVAAISALQPPSGQ